MSYEKVKSIKIEGDKVFICCASNNVRPLLYLKEEYPYFSNILKAEGLNACEIALLKIYEEGTLQQGKNKYSKAFEILRNLYGEEYKNFDWRVLSCEERRSKENTPEFKQLLLKALNTPYPKEQYILYCPYRRAYVKKITMRYISFSDDLKNAKKFRFYKDAKYYQERKGYKILNLKGGAIE